MRKKKIILLLSLMSATFSLSAQKAFLNINSGYSVNYNDYRKYSDDVNTIPYNITVGGGWQSIQIYAQYSSDFVKPEYEFKDTFVGNTRFSEIFEFKRLGLGVRANTASDGGEFGVLFRLGINQAKVERSIKLQNGDNYENEKFKSIGFVGALGFSIPLGDTIAITIESQYNYLKIKNDNIINFSSWDMALLGVTIGLND